MSEAIGLRRALDTYKLCTPEGVASGSVAQMKYFVADAKHDIALLAEVNADLLEALKMAQLWLDVDGRFDMQGINAAIAKAEGRP